MPDFEAVRFKDELLIIFINWINIFILSEKENIYACI